jgi:hypothetical protein
MIATACFVQAEKHAERALSDLLNKGGEGNASAVQQAQAVLESTAAARRALEARLSACRNRVGVTSSALQESSSQEVGATTSVVLRLAAVEASLVEQLAAQVGVWLVVHDVAKKLLA